MRVTAILLAAGKGQRLRSSIPKALILLRGHPVIWYSLRAFNQHPLINDIIVVVNKKNACAISECIKRYRFGKVSTLALGGKLRQDSVKNGLCCLPDATSVVVIHDGARPLVEGGIISAVIKEAARSGAAITGVPVKATIKVARSNGLVKETLDRSKLWEIQTPQAFRKKLLLKAYQAYGTCEVTDDAMLIEKLRAPVAIIPGSYHNIKITTPEDLLIAEAIAKKIAPRQSTL